jgi:hypothetical protein
MPSDYALSTVQRDFLARIVKTGGKNHKSVPRPLYTRGEVWRVVRSSRVRHLIAQWSLDFLLTHERVEESGNGSWDATGPYVTIAFRTGVSTRAIYRILNGESYWTDFSTVDKLLTGLDLVHLWHLQPTNKFKSDGFADIYYSMPSEKEIEGEAWSPDKHKRGVSCSNCGKRRRSVRRFYPLCKECKGNA